MHVKKLRLKMALGVGLAVLITGCQPKTATSSVAFKVPVTVESVTTRTVEEIIKTTGTVRPEEQVTLTVNSDGLLQIADGENGPINEGDHVKAGDIIANIIGEDVRLSVNLQAAKKRLEVATENLAASTELFKDRLVSVDRHGRDKTDYADAKHAYDVALNNQKRSQITTPIDGVVVQLARTNGQSMANGQLVVPGQAVAVISPMNPLIADVDIVGKDITRVKAGMQAITRYHGWPSKTFASELVRISPTINEVTRSLRAQIKVANEQELLKPGMFVETSIIVQRKENVVVVPRRALTQRGGLRVVFVVDGQRAMQREVQLGLEDAEFVEIVSGLSVGESVVVLGLQTLTDQMPVSITGS